LIPSTTRNPPIEGAFAATVASAAMVAQQVAGKAARDALFLSSFHVRNLPIMMAVSACVSLGGVLWLSSLMTRHSPRKVVPTCFAVSGVALLCEWFIGFWSPGISAIAVYVHTSVFGAAVISAFWSLVNERFDPHTAKRAFSRIGGGGTLGGVVGALLAMRAAHHIEVPTMLPLLAASNLVCLGGTVAIGAPPSHADRPSREVGPNSAKEVLSPFQVLRAAPYLRGLALLVALGAVTSGALDYVFNAEAVKSYSGGPQLLSFFSLFWLIVGVLSFGLQTLLGRVALEKLGLVVTVAILPGIVVLGGAIGVAVPGLGSMSFLRGAESVQRNSLFRSAYELLYAPLSEGKKRSTKTIIDVGCDRLGTVLVSGLAVAVIAVAPHHAEMVILCVGVAASAITLTQSRKLHLGYVAVLEESLRQAAKRMPVSGIGLALRPAERRDTMVRDQIAEVMLDLPKSSELAAIGGGDAVAAPLRDTPAPPTDRRLTPAALVDSVAALTSGDAPRIRSVLRANAPLPPQLVNFAIMLLSDTEVSGDAIVALQASASRSPGQLLDALLDPTVDFVVRRRIPRVVSTCATQFVADGLMRGLRDDRFEVRFECGRALMSVTETNTDIAIPLASVITTVKWEIEMSKQVLDSQSLDLESDVDQRPPLINRLLHDRIDRNVEHIFTVLSLVLERESLRLAFKALHHEDLHTRGTALEYLENVLPGEVRDDVWPYLGEERALRPRRETKEILADLRRAPGVLGLGAKEKEEAARSVPSGGTGT
jgi:AAA family ATP:ADP antiporter